MFQIKKRSPDGAEQRKRRTGTRIVKADSEDYLRVESEKKASKAPKKEKKPKDKKPLGRRLTALLGGAFIVFAIIGIISTGTGLVRLVGNIINENSRKNRSEEFLTPIVMLDPVYFDSSAKAGQSFLIQSSIWYLVYNNGTDYYYIDDVGNVAIPASDVEVAATKIFGKGVELVHQSVGDVTNITSYIEDTDTYHLPVSTGYNIYTPIVHDISKSGDTVTLTVGYLPPSPNWGDDRLVSAKPDKFAYYVVKEDADEMNLIAIKEMSSEQQLALIAEYEK